MLRWLIGLLVVANLGYAAWHVGMTPTSTQKMVQVEQSAVMVSAPVTLKVVDEAGHARPSATGLCASLEYWSKRGDALVARQRLGALGKQGRVESVQLEMPLDWVHLAPFASRQQADVKLAELQEKHIDSFIVNTGDQVNAISLGYFRDHALALDLQRTLQQDGIEANIEPVHKKVTEYRLLLGQVDAALLAGALKKMPGVESRWQACDD